MESAAALAPLDGDAFRFVAVASGGRTAQVFEGRRKDGRAERTLVQLTATVTGWSVITRDTRYLAAESFDYYAGLIDAATPAAPEACENPPVYFAVHGDRAVSGGCPADDATGRIARALGLVDEDTGPVLLK